MAAPSAALVPYEPPLASAALVLKAPTRSFALKNGGALTIRQHYGAGGSKTGGAVWDARTQTDVGSVPQGISADLIAQLGGDMEARRYPSNRHGAAALVACARLCALDPSDLLALRDDTTEEEEAGADPNAKLDEALRRLCVDGRLSEDNDRKAAELVRAAARRQLEALEGVGVQEMHDGITSKGGGTAGGCSVREECVRLVQDVRASEMHVLRALALGDGADRLLGLVRVSKAER